MHAELRETVVELKDFESRNFNLLTNNFYIIRAALRYYSSKKGISFTSKRISEDFPLTIPVAGSCLRILDSLDVVEVRTKSSAPNRYMPETVDLERLEEVRKILVENMEIEEF